MPDRAFEDTVRNLLRMKPKPHKGKAEDEEKGERGGKSSPADLPAENGGETEGRE